MSVRVPTYRLHRASGQAVVTLGGRDHYLGLHGSDASKEAYRRLLAEHMIGGCRIESGSDLTVAELILAYLKFADGYYRKNGRPTKEPEDIKYALRPLRELYGRTPAAEFGPLRLKAVRQAMIEAGLCRTEINKRIGKIARAFKWGVSEEMVPPSVYEGLRAVSGLRKGRSGARESEPVKPVPDAFVDAIRPFVSRQVWAMVQLQLLTGMRPGEVVAMRTIDLDTTGRVWTYTPPEHKTEHHGKARSIHVGPRAQSILRPWLRTELERPLFAPAEAMAERRAEMRAGRKSPVQPSQRDRSKARPRKRPGDAYTVESYRRAIKYACTKAGVPDWHPHQLRHSAATRIRKEHGLDAARAVLGHSSTAVTEVYAMRDEALASQAMERLG